MKRPIGRDSQISRYVSHAASRDLPEIDEKCRLVAEDEAGPHLGQFYSDAARMLGFFP